MAVQAIWDKKRRWAFALFSLVWAFRVFFESSHDVLATPTFELLRLFWIGLYCASVLFLFDYPIRWALGSLALITGSGYLVWKFYYFSFATSCIFPIGFGLVAWAHGRQYLKTQGYASCILSAYSILMALLATTYFSAMSTADNRIIVLGYAHFAILSLLSTVLGWIYLPRELRGQAPVKVEKQTAIFFFVFVITAELGVLAGQLWLFHWPPILYLISSGILIAGAFYMFFRYRHQLVIYAENVTQLLEERTASLQEAQGELAKQNQKLAEKLAEQASELQAKSKVIERQRRLELAAQTAGEAAHDIQNLIAPIQSYAVQIEQVKNQSSETAQLSQKIQLQVNLLLELNHQMLALSRRGRMELHPVNLGEVAKQAASQFRNGHLMLEIENDIWVQGSWAQLVRAVSNLIANALEAQANGFVAVRIRCGFRQVSETLRCHLGFLSPGKYAFLSVQDSGPGIPNEILEQIFEPFFSAKQNSLNSGSGLGLSIVNAVVDDHRGVIDVQTDSRGSCFTVFLPAMEAFDDAQTHKLLSGNETVMVIDEHKPNRDKISAFLEEAGYFVIAEPSSAEALKIIQTEQVDILLIDLHTKPLTALQTFYGAMHLSPGIRAIVYSKNIGKREAAELRAMGVSVLLETPFNRIDTLHAIRQTIQERPIPIS